MAFAVHPTALPGVLRLNSEVHGDSRGFFKEFYRAEALAEAGIEAVFVQDNQSRSSRGALRGLHFQEPSPQGKLLQVARGAVYDVVLDVRRGSPDFGRWIGLQLTDETGDVLWVPPGFAHGFVVLSDVADVIYKVTDYWRPEAERAVRWDDPALGIDWPISEPVLSARDAAAEPLAAQTVLPDYEGAP